MELETKTKQNNKVLCVEFALLGHIAMYILGYLVVKTEPTHYKMATLQQDEK